MVGILLSYWGGLFSGAMLVSGRVGGFFTPFITSRGPTLWVQRVATAGIFLGFASIELDNCPPGWWRKEINLQTLGIQSPENGNGT